MKDYRIKIRVKNNCFLTLMEGAGYVSVAQLSRFTDLSVGCIHDIANLKSPAVKSNGEWREAVLKVADALSCEPWELYPSQHIEKALPLNSGEIEASLEEVEAFLPKETRPDLLIESQEARDLLARALSHLSPRNERVVRMKYGIGCEQKTSKEIAGIFDISPSRAHQIGLQAEEHLKKFHLRQSLMEDSS